MKKKGNNNNNINRKKGREKDQELEKKNVCIYKITSSVR